MIRTPCTPRISALLVHVGLLTVGLLACGDKSDDDTTGGSDGDTDSDTDGAVACDPDIDADCDGVPDDEDCAPDDARTYPGAPELPYDGVDNDCAGGGDLRDVDGDRSPDTAHFQLQNLLKDGSGGLYPQPKATYGNDSWQFEGGSIGAAGLIYTGGQSKAPVEPSSSDSHPDKAFVVPVITALVSTLGCLLLVACAFGARRLVASCFLSWSPPFAPASRSTVSVRMRPETC